MTNKLTEEQYNRPIKIYSLDGTYMPTSVRELIEHGMSLDEERHGREHYKPVQDAGGLQ